MSFRLRSRCRSPALSELQRGTQSLSRKANAETGLNPETRDSRCGRNTAALGAFEFALSVLCRCQCHQLADNSYTDEGSELLKLAKIARRIFVLQALGVKQFPGFEPFLDERRTVRGSQATF